MLLQAGLIPGIGSNPNNPLLIQDVFFRIGGATPGQATISLQINTDNVNGANVIAYGLFVEHYQNYQVIWNGENGETIFFQNEMPYDPPNQAAWSHNGVNGFASYKVADWVKSHQAFGTGSYCFFEVNPSIINDHAFEVPATPEFNSRIL